MAQYSTQIFLKFRNEEAYANFLSDFSLCGNKLDPEKGSDFCIIDATTTFRSDRSNYTVNIAMAIDEEQTKSIISGIAEHMKNDAIILGYSLNYSGDEVLWGYYYLGERVHEIVKLGRYAVNFSNKSFDDIGKWLGTEKKFLSEAEKANLKSISKAKKQ